MPDARHPVHGSEQAPGVAMLTRHSGEGSYGIFIWR